MMPGRVSPPPKKVNYYSRKSIFSFSIVLLYIYLIQAIVCSFFIGPDSPTSNLLYYINIHSTSESVLCSTSEYLGTHHIFPYSSDSIKLKFENLFFFFLLAWVQMARISYQSFGLAIWRTDLERVMGFCRPFVSRGQGDFSWNPIGTFVTRCSLSSATVYQFR